jgi:hypothetical protein
MLKENSRKRLRKRKGSNMKFKIPKIPSSTPKTIRFPNDIIERVENAIVGKECTFSAFVNEAVKEALQCLEDNN